MSATSPGPNEPSPARVKRKRIASAPSAPSKRLANLAGYDLDIVPRYAGPDAKHEQTKLVCIGASVPIPAVLSLVGTPFAAAPFVASIMARWIIALFVAVMIFWVRPYHLRDDVE